MSFLGSLEATFAGATLLLPAVSFGNVDQMALDLLLNTQLAAKVWFCGSRAACISCVQSLCALVRSALVPPRRYAKSAILCRGTVVLWRATTCSGGSRHEARWQ